jgi:hypothetical protein
MTPELARQRVNAVRKWLESRALASDTRQGRCVYLYDAREILRAIRKLESVVDGLRDKETAR